MHKNLRTSILPSDHTYAKTKDVESLHLSAICIFAATGFFMDDDTFWNNQRCLLPAHSHEIDDNGFLISSTPNFKWHYSPKATKFENALEEYIYLLRTIMKDQVKDSPVILPLSGGLDSRSQALILKDFDNPVHSYSYSFQDGFAEHGISKKVAKVCGFSFDSFMIPKGYLWDSIDELAEINHCYSEFTQPRQMAILRQLKQMEGTFSLGHWGDVFFDRGAPEGIEASDIIPLLLKKMLKPGGLYLAEQLWRNWDLEGDFKTYLISRIETSLSKIKIDNISAKVRAFKTSQWAHRWTTTNLSIFETAHPITMPYYDNRMCEFICTIPEGYLADRRLQIAHLKQNKELSNITWQAQNPFSINTYKYNRPPYNVPYRYADKLKRMANGLLGNPYIQRNYELQFLGDANDQELKARIFNPAFKELISKSVVTDIYNKFKNEDDVYYSHPMSMLVTLSIWNQKFNQPS